MLRLSGLHLLLTYQCTLACDHCFVWGRPEQTGTMTVGQVRQILHQARAVETITWVYFEGGEPFLYYAILLSGVRLAASLGFHVGIVSNAYWATDVHDALEWLRPFAGLVQDLSVSGDPYHGDASPQQAAAARRAADILHIPGGTISIALPDARGVPAAAGQLPPGESGVMFRGRAARRLAARGPHRPWEEFGACPYEDLADPRRVHVDPLGYVHLCQGIIAGNVFQTPLAEICARYEPSRHPVAGPLLAGGPAALVRRYDLAPGDGYADACHLCDEARRALRPRFPEVLGPDQMYGVGETD